MTSERPALSIEKLKRHFLECTICKEQYDDEDKHPRVLPCLHSFCYSCLRRLIENKKYTCPLCNSDFRTENITPDVFPKDNTRRDLLDFVHAADENTFLACDECDENEKSIARCKDCFKFLGENCLKAHKSMKTFAKHKVFTLRDVTFDVNSISDFQSAGICPNHNEVLKLYCSGKDCRGPICHSCCLTSHMDDKYHVRRNIDEVYNEKRDILLEKEIQLKDMANELDQLYSKVEQTVEYLDENSKEVEREITAIFQTAIELLQRRRNCLLEEVRGIKKDKETVLLKQEDEIGFLRQNINDACEFMDQSLASKNQAAFLILSNTIAERFDYLLNRDFNKVPHDVNLINFRKCNLGAYFQLIVNMLGGVVSTTAYSPNTVVNIPHTIDKNEVFEFELIFYDFTNSEISEKIIVTYTLFDNKDNIFTDCEEILMTEDDGGKYKTSCTILDDADRISKILIKVNGKKFHCINIETTIKDGKEKSAYDKEISVAEHDIKNRVIYHRNEYAATESRKEDTLTENEIEEKLSELAKKNSSPKNGQEEKLTEHEKDSTTSDIGTEDTVTVHAKENILNDDEPEYELNHYGVEKPLTKQANNEEQNITVCAVHGGKCTRMPISFKHIFKWQVWPENKLILVLNIIHECDITVLIAGIGRSVECTSIITVMKCKECQTLWSLTAEFKLKMKRSVFQDTGSLIADCLETQNGEVVFLVKTEFDTCKIYVLDEHLRQIQEESAPIGSRNLMICGENTVAILGTRRLTIIKICSCIRTAVVPLPAADIPATSHNDKEILLYTNNTLLFIDCEGRSIDNIPISVENCYLLHASNEFLYFFCQDNRLSVCTIKGREIQGITFPERVCSCTTAPDGGVLAVCNSSSVFYISADGSKWSLMQSGFEPMRSIHVVCFCNQTKSLLFCHGCNYVSVYLYEK
ncbi:TRIM33 [Mytilus coruscus]|uniref:TRIM33 n=1 Tax=Mytilus coruscus TaxID=42192 RepID=A0A6J8E7S7_MYTCO|nr:TRIM33 [Mytilus coruscus]